MWTSVSFGVGLAILSLRRPFPRSAVVPLVFILPVMFGWEILFRSQVVPPPRWPWLFVAVPAFALGVVLRRRPSPGPGMVAGNRDVQRAGAVVVATVGVLTVLHFARAGIPVLSTGIEMARFDFSASGLGGIPSRAVLFSLPILVLAVECRRGLLSPRARWVAWGLFVLSRLALGFKGSLIEVGLVVVLAFLISGRKFTSRVVALGAAGALTAVAYSALVGRRYATIQATGGVSWDYYVDRLTSQSARPGWLLLNLDPGQFVGGSVWVQDTQYFLEKYFGLQFGVNFASDQIVSSLLTGTVRSSTSFLVPVTTGAAPYLLASMGVLAASIALAGMGWLWSTAERLIVMSPRVAGPFAGAALMLAIKTGFSNGALVYLLINEAVGLLIVLVPLWIAHQSLVASAQRGSYA